MSIRTSPWPQGVPCWVDLAVPEVGAVSSFYAEVLGWSIESTGDEYGGYVIAHVDGAATAGIGPQQAGGPAAWTLYLATDDADHTADAIGRHGGKVLLAPSEVGPVGRMLVAADPTGAVFGVWQAAEHIGAGLVNEPGGLVWEDLRSPDPEMARAFYRSVFGYQTEPVPAAGPDFETFGRPGEAFPLGGMGGLEGADGAPAHWVVYFAVADTERTVEVAERAGGEVLATDLESSFGAMAGLRDPAGATFWVLQTDGTDQPDRSG